MSIQKKRTFGDLLFWFQIVCAAIFFTAQSLKMLESTQGVSLSYFMWHGIFFVINLSLSIAALKNAAPDEREIKLQSVFIYSFWIVIILTHLGIAYFHMDDHWKRTDTVSCWIVSIGVLITTMVANRKNLSLLDPYVKTSLAIFFKSIPQLALAMTIYAHGKGGISAWFIIIGQLTISTRLFHICVSNPSKWDAWDRNARGLFMSEIWSGASWLAIIVAWVYA